MSEMNVQRNYKDTVFRMLFREKELQHALSDRDYREQLYREYER